MQWEYQQGKNTKDGATWKNYSKGKTLMELKNLTMIDSYIVTKTKYTMHWVEEYIRKFVDSFQILTSKTSY